MFRRCARLHVGHADGSGLLARNHARFSLIDGIGGHAVRVAWNDVHHAVMGRTVVQELVDHHPVVAEHRPDQLGSRGRDALNIGLKADAPDQRLGEIERVLRIAAAGIAGFELDEHPLLIAVHRDVERRGRLRLVGVLAPLVDPEIAELLAAERATRQHAFHRLFDDALGESAVQNELRGPFLDAARVTGVVEIDLLLLLAAGEDHLVRIHHDDVVAVVHVRREGRLVLAAKAERDQRGEAADHEAFRIDHHPLLLDVGRFGRIGLAKHEDSGSVTKKRPPNREPQLPPS